MVLETSKEGSVSKLEQVTQYSGDGQYKRAPEEIWKLIRYTPGERFISFKELASFYKTDDLFLLSEIERYDLGNVINREDTLYIEKETAKRIISQYIMGQNGLERKSNITLADLVENKYPGTDSGIKLTRYFTDGVTDPLDAVKYVNRPQKIIDEKKEVKWQREDLYFPESWSDLAVKVTASKYLFTPHKKEYCDKFSNGAENNPKQLFSRISNTLAKEGLKQDVFKTEEDAKTFKDELNYLLINQKLAFNSPVNFNLGLHDEYGIGGPKSNNWAWDFENGKPIPIHDSYSRPQCSACFIHGTADTRESITEIAKDELNIFSFGSGDGQEISTYRAKGEYISTGGWSSGPLSWLKLWDTVAGIIKSGGKSRRAARMTTMKYWHRDIFDFIRAKTIEELKAIALVKAGFSGGFEGDAYSSVAFQNTNLTVRLDDEFYKAVKNNGKILLRNTKNWEGYKEVSAQEILKETSYGTWRVGDPGVQNEDIIQEYHTCKNSGPINSSNPCSEYMFLDDTSCNLASLNLVKFLNENEEFMVEDFIGAVTTAIIAQEIIVDKASYPNDKFTQLSHDYRTLGLGYANLGGLLMRKGIPYDSKEGRAYAAAITSLMTATAYKTSAELAKAVGAFRGYTLNEGPMLEVIDKHRKNNSLENILNEYSVGTSSRKEMRYWSEFIKIRDAAQEVWDSAYDKGKQYGFRNAQTTVLAPTGTIAFMMDCDTTGVEPNIAKIGWKTLSGGGVERIVAKSIGLGLKSLGYSEEERSEILNYIFTNKTVIGAPHLSPKHYNIFDTAYPSVKGDRAISTEGHIRMVAKTQPFISGAISKTMNLPHETTVKDIYDSYLLAYELGVKAVAPFRDRSKKVQVLNTGMQIEDPEFFVRGQRRHLPQEKEQYGVKFKIGGISFQLTTGEYSEGTLGELFITVHQPGSDFGAWADEFAYDVSQSLQHGTSLEKLIDSYVGVAFNPSGLTDHPWIRMVRSPLDFIFRWIGLHYLGRVEYADDKEAVDKNKLRAYQNGSIEIIERSKINEWDYHSVINGKLGGFISDGENKEAQRIQRGHNKNNNKPSGKACRDCGSMMFQTAPNCYQCSNCGSTNGGCG